MKIPEKESPRKTFQESWFHVSSLKGPHCSLPEEEQHHARKVFRLPDGCEIMVTDGSGGLARAKLGKGKTETRLYDIHPINHQQQEPVWQILLPILKARDSEVPAEALFQLPIQSITLIETNYSRGIKETSKLVQRLTQKSFIGLKQAKKTWLTHIGQPVTLQKWIKNNPEKCLFWAEEGEEILPEKPPVAPVLLTGPEGGFSSEEKQMLKNHPNCYRINLGLTRIKAVHAPVFAMGKLMGYWETLWGLR